MRALDHESYHSLLQESNHSCNIVTCFVTRERNKGARADTDRELRDLEYNNQLTRQPHTGLL